MNAVPRAAWPTLAPPPGLLAGRVEARVWRDDSAEPFIVLHDRYTLRASVVQCVATLQLAAPALDLDQDEDLVIEWTAWVDLPAPAAGVMVSTAGPCAPTIDLDGNLLVSLTRDCLQPPESRVLPVVLAPGWHRFIVDDASLESGAIELAAIGADGRRQPLTPHVAKRPEGDVQPVTRWLGHGSFT